jgi:hypothetical protein
MKNKYILFTLIPAVLIAGMLTGCFTPPPGKGGFPLIDIVDAEVDLADDSQFIEEDVQWVRSANTKIIGGTLKSKITPKDLTIRLIDTSIQIPIKEGEDLSSWFLNIPRGLKATAHSPNRDAKYAAVKGDTEVIVTIEGIPEQTINQPVKICVPYEKTNRSWDFHIPPNDDIRFEIYGVDIAAVVVGGAVNREIDPKTFTIKFGGTKLTEIIPKDTDISAWFTNIPRGLKAIVAEDAVPVTEVVQIQADVQEGKPGKTTQSAGKLRHNPEYPQSQSVTRTQQSLLVTMSGTATTQINENMIIVIPADKTTANIVLAIPPSEKAKYDIGSYAVTSATDTELRSGSNWKGAVTGWGLTGPEVFKLKDFTPVGIIQIESESTYAIGEDGEKHWTGAVITYGKLMAEAKKLNAHAIIDVVIDDDDTVNETIERRHIEANHEPSKLEKIKIQKGIIKVENDPNGGNIYVETVETIKRISTGTALAIQYAPAYQPSVGDGSATGYVPAYGTESAADAVGKK